jgi:cyclopropane-fatty-acyl-phospholipid synthase
MSTVSRDVAGTFDAVVSVEMIEAVGERSWRTYFRALDPLLAPGGRSDCRRS